MFLNGRQLLYYPRQLITLHGIRYWQQPLLQREHWHYWKLCCEFCIKQWRSEDQSKSSNHSLYKSSNQISIDVNAIAKGYAVERKNNASGDVALFELVLAEYKKAPQITKDRYFIETMNDIFSKSSNKVIVDTRLENFLPMLNLKNKEKK